MGDEGSYGKSPRPRSVGGLFLMLLAHPIRSSSPPARDVADVEEPEEVASHLPGAASVADFRTQNSAVQMGQLIMHCHSDYLVTRETVRCRATNTKEIPAVGLATNNNHNNDNLD